LAIIYMYIIENVKFLAVMNSLKIGIKKSKYILYFIIKYFFLV
jgi:hypothetical protein